MQNHNIDKKLFDNVLRTLRVVDGARDRETSGEEEPPPNPRRRDFGFGMLGLSIFTLILTTLVPSGDRWMFGFFAFALLLVAAWEIDRPQREIRKQQRIKSKIQR